MVYYPRWTYFDENGENVEVMADMVDIKQVFVVEDEYTSRRAAKRAMHQEDNFNFQNVCRELFAQC